MNASLKSLVKNINPLFLVVPFLFYYYLGPLRPIVLVIYIYLFLCALFGFLSGRIDSDRLNLLMFLVFITFMFWLFAFGGVISHVLSFRLVYGFSIIFLGFYFQQRVALENVFLFLGFITISEKLCIMVYPDLINILPNYDSGLTFYSENASSIFGGVHSFGGNRSVSGVLLLACYLFLKNSQAAKWKCMIVLMASVICASGTSLLILATYLLYSFFINTFKNGGNHSRIKSFFLLLIFGFLMASIFMATTYEEAIFDRFSFYYLEYIFDYKMNQISDFIDSGNIFDWIFGLGELGFTTASDEVAGYGSRYGDFILLDLVSRYGLCGMSLLIFMVFILAYKNKYKSSLWVILLGTLHYHVLFSGPGQVIMALIALAGLDYSRARFVCGKINSRYSST